MNSNRPGTAPADKAPAEKARILVVDDLPEKHVVFRTILEELDQEVISAYSGKEALRCVLEMEFAVILLDVNMPDIDGLETAGLIRQYRKSAQTPIVFITAYVDEVQASRGYALGAVDYIPSPVIPEVLRSKVKVFVDLFRMNRQLQLQVAEREQLARSEAALAAAEAADMRKNEFLAMLAHELRNPLAPIRNAVHIMNRIEMTHPALTMARDVIARQADHMSRLIDDLLDVSRIVQGKVTVHAEQLALAVLMERSVEASLPKLDAVNQVLDIVLPPGEVVVNGDVVRLAQVLSNLINNASKFSPPGSTIYLHAAYAGGQLAITVRDKGAGIDAAFLPRVFDLFAQADHSLDRSQGGLGIGLTLVKHLVELHGGRVTAHSDGLGCGTEVTVYLPAQQAVPGAPGQAGPAVPEIAPPAPRSKVLVVDDLAESAQTMQMLLQMEGYDVRIATEGMAALKLAEEFRPDAVLLDIGLPGMNGFEVALRLRKQPSSSHALMIALTGYGEAGSRQASEEAGFDYHMVKPANVQLLLSMLADPQAARKAQAAKA